MTTPELERLSAELGVKYTDLVQHGLWDTPIREAIDALVANVQQKVTGTVRVKLHKGDCRVVGRSSPKEVRDEHALVRPLHLGAR